jgi:hypothetical protein
VFNVIDGVNFSLISGLAPAVKEKEEEDEALDCIKATPDCWR